MISDTLVYNIFLYKNYVKQTKVIITAMLEEAELIIEKYSLTEDKKQGFMTLYTWERDNDEWEIDEIILCLCGVGKIHSTMATTYLFENYQITKLINIWVVGNLVGDAMKIGDVIIPNTFLQHDSYVPEFLDTLSYLREPIFVEYAIGENYDLQKFSLRLSGICVTGDQFIDDPEKMGKLVDDHGADIVDMEAYAILSVAKAYDSLDLCVCVKSVSDGADSDAAKDHKDNLTFAMENATAILDFII